MTLKTMLLAGTVAPLLAIAAFPATAAPPAVHLAQAGPWAAPAPPPAAVPVPPAPPAAAPTPDVPDPAKELDRKRRSGPGRPDAAQAKPDAAAPAPPAALAKPEDRRPADPRRRPDADRPPAPAANAAPPPPPATPPAVTILPVAPTPPAARVAAPPPALVAPAAPPPVAPQAAPGARQAQTPPAPAAASPAPPAPGPWGAPPAPRQPPGARPPAPPAAAQAAPPPAITAATAPPPAAATEMRARRLDDIRGSRVQTQEGNRTVIREGGRTIIQEGNRSIIQHNETDRFRTDGRTVTEQRRGADTVSIAVRPDGTRVESVVDPSGRLQRRSSFDKGGREIVLIDNRRAPPLDARAYVNLPPARYTIPRNRYIVAAGVASAALIYETLRAPPVEAIDRAYGLDEIRYSAPLRDRMRRIDVDSITFDTGSWDVKPDQAGKLKAIADGMLRAIRANPAEVFLVEGHTDAVGTDVDNLSLSDRRAEAVANVLSERFGVPPENLTTQGYGEEFLKVPATGPERQNRRVAVRRITPLLSGNSEAPT